MPVSHKPIQVDLLRTCRDREIVTHIRTTAQHRQQFINELGSSTCPIRTLKVRSIASVEHSHSSINPLSLQMMDVILDGGSLAIECSSKINNLEWCLSMDWIEEPLRHTLGLSGFQMEASWTNEGFQSAKVMVFRTRRSSASIATPLSYLLGQSAPHATLHKVYLVLEFGSNCPHRLGELLMKDPRSSVLDDYLAVVLDRVICGRLCADYPLIFSSMYSKNLSAITQYIPIFARTIQRILTRSNTDGSQTHTQTQQMTQQRSGSSAGSIALSNVWAIGTRTKILRPPPTVSAQTETTPKSDDDHDGPEALIRRDLVIGLYYSAKCTLKFAKIKPTETHTPVPSISQDIRQQQEHQQLLQYIVPYEDIADLWTVPEA